MQKVIIFGLGPLSVQLNHYLSKNENFSVEFFCVDEEYYRNAFHEERKVLIFEKDLDNLERDEYKWIISTGYNNLYARKLIFDKIKALGFSFINYIHPNADIQTESIGEGNIIFSNTVVECFSKIQDNNIIWSNATICHDTNIGSHNFIAAGSVIGGFCNIGCNNFFGFSSVIAHKTDVGSSVVIGANSLLMDHAVSNTKYYGSPARQTGIVSEEGVKIV